MGGSELGDGEHSLRELLRRLDREAIPIDHAIALAIGTAATVHASHNEGAPIAGAVAPANVIVDGNGNLRIDRRNVTIEAGYLAPEVVAGKRIDRRGDVYALGVVIYELLTHKLPFYEGQLVPLSRRRGDVPAKLDDIIAKSLEAAPIDRFQSAIALKTALEQLPRSAASSLIGYIKKQFCPRLPEIAPVPTHVIRTRTVPIAALEWPATSDGVPAAPMRGPKVATARIPALPADSDAAVRRPTTVTQSARIVMPIEAPRKQRTRTVQIPALAQPVITTSKPSDATDDGWGEALDSWLPSEPVVVAKPARLIDIMAQGMKPATPLRLPGVAEVAPADARTTTATAPAATAVGTEPDIAAPATARTMSSPPIVDAKSSRVEALSGLVMSYVPTELSAGWTDGTFVDATSIESVLRASARATREPAVVSEPHAPAPAGSTPIVVEASQTPDEQAAPIAASPTTAPDAPVAASTPEPAPVASSTPADRDAPPASTAPVAAVSTSNPQVARSRSLAELASASAARAAAARVAASAADARVAAPTSTAQGSTPVAVAASTSAAEQPAAVPLAVVAASTPPDDVPSTSASPSEHGESPPVLRPSPRVATEEMAELLESDVDLGDFEDAVVVSAVPEPIRSEAMRRRLDADPDPIVDSPSTSLRRLVDSQAPVIFEPTPTPPPVQIRTRTADVTPSGELMALSHARELGAVEARPRRRWIATAASSVGAIAIAVAILAVRAGDRTPASAPVVDPPLTAAEPAPDKPAATPPVKPAMLTVKPAATKPAIAKPPVAKPPIASSAAKPIGVAKPMGIAKPPPARPTAIKPVAKPVKKATLLWDPDGLFAPKKPGAK